VQKFDRKQMDDLYSFLLPVWKEAYRILYPGGFLLSFGSPRLIGAISWAAHVAGFELRDEAIWEHEGGQPKAQRHTRWVQQMKISSAEKRRIVALLDDRTTVQLRPKYEPFIVAQKPANGTQVQNFVKYGVGLIKSYDLDGKYRTPIFQHPKPRTRGEFDHMTIKPLELIEDILGVFAGPHSVVVDPFTGSGTTGVAALHLGHSFIGFEKDSQHCATALQRLKEAYE
jgi:site-specific DNA-methyltransferase (adenine-specific)